MLHADRFASGANPTPRWRDARQTTRRLKFQKEGGAGSPRAGAGGSPLAKRRSQGYVVRRRH